MKGGIGWRLITSALDRYPWKFYLTFLSQEIDIKLCQIYMKTHIYTFLNRNSWFKQIICSKYATNRKLVGQKFSWEDIALDDATLHHLKTKISQRNLNVTWRVQKIDHVIQTETHDHYTALPLVGVLVT